MAATRSNLRAGCGGGQMISVLLSRVDVGAPDCAGFETIDADGPWQF